MASPFRSRAEDLWDYEEALLLSAATGKIEFRLRMAALAGDAVDLPGLSEERLYAMALRDHPQQHPKPQVPRQPSAENAHGVQMPLTQ